MVLLAAGVGAALVVGDGERSHVDRAAGQDAIPAASGVAASGAGVLGVEAVDEPRAPADVGTTAAEHEGGDEGEGDGTTGGVCPACPKVEDPEPAPSHRRDEPRKVKKPRLPPPKPEDVEPACTDVDAEAQAANDARQWSRVLKLTKSARCWKNDGKREWLRVRAFSQTNRYTECAELGAASGNPEAKRLGKSCAAQLDQEEMP